MRMRLLVAAVVCLGMTTGCANFIRLEDTVIWDRVPGTERVSLDDFRIDGATVYMKVRFTCQKRQYAVTNIYETPYDPKAELYEVPVGLVAFAPAVVWYIGSELFTLGSIDKSVAVAPLCWSTAGFNPFLNCENGMFHMFVGDRYVIREKKGSRRPQSGSSPEPYDAVVAPKDGKIRLRFVPGDWVTLDIGDDLLMRIDLLEAAPSMPSPDAQRIEVEVTFQWDPSAPVATKKVTFAIDRALARKLYALRDACRTVMETRDPAAFDRALSEIESAGFSKEAAMLRAKYGGKLTPAR